MQRIENEQGPSEAYSYYRAVFAPDPLLMDPRGNRSTAPDCSGERERDARAPLCDRDPSMPDPRCDNDPLAALAPALLSDRACDNRSVFSGGSAIENAPIATPPPPTPVMLALCG